MYRKHSMKCGFSLFLFFSRLTWILQFLYVCVCLLEICVIWSLKISSLCFHVTASQTMKKNAPSHSMWIGLISILRIAIPLSLHLLLSLSLSSSLSVRRFLCLSPLSTYLSPSNSPTARPNAKEEWKME